MIAYGLFLLLPGYGSGKSVDFLILEDPASLEILSRYEQSLTSAEKKAILPFAPLQVVGEKSVLGDGITAAMEVEYEGNAYYLPRRGWAEKPPAVRRHRGCRLEEGGEKRAGADLPCTRGPAPGGPSVTLRAGETLQTVFTCGTRTYVKKTEAKAGYLWCPAGGPFAAKGKDSAVGETGLGPEMQSRLRSRMESANEAYASHTRAFNRLTGESRKPPRWDCSLSRDGMRCRMEGGLRSEALEISTAVLVKELGNSLTGKPYEAAFREGEGGGEIAVSPRAGKSPRRP